MTEDNLVGMSEAKMPNVLVKSIDDYETAVPLEKLKKLNKDMLELPEDFRATGYSITTGTADASNAPKTWIFQGSTDGTTWSDIDTRSNQLFQFPKETSMYQVYIPDHSSANAALLPSFKYFRMLFSENNGGTGLNLAFGITIAFSFIMMMKVTSVFSIKGNLHPIISVLIPIFVFAIISVFLIRKAPK